VSARKTGRVFIDVGWHRRTGEREWYGFPLSDEPEVLACWNVEDESNPQHPFVEVGFEQVDKAIVWARERAELVLVRNPSRPARSSARWHPGGRAVRLQRGECDSAGVACGKT
jgi:hypothetical protein